MPSHSQHCADCELKLGKPFPEVHTWLDALYDSRSGDLGHRAARHHMEGVEEVRRMWGDDAARAAKLHIMLDWDGILEEEIPKTRADAERFAAGWLSRLLGLDETNSHDG